MADRRALVRAVADARIGVGPCVDCTSIGPEVPQDIELNYPILFRMEWMQHLLHASYKQRDKGSEDTPDVVADKSYDELYTRLRAQVLEETRGAPLTYEAVHQAVKENEEAARGK